MEPLTGVDVRPGPIRTCVGCRERSAKRELLRVVAGTDAHGPAVVPDPRGSAPGRGAHLHPTIACLDLAERSRAFARALRFAPVADAKSGKSLSTVNLREHLTSEAEQTDRPR